MRTTLDIDDDVLAAAMELGQQKNLSIGQMVSLLLRTALTNLDATTSPGIEASAYSVAGFRPFPAGKAPVTNETINRLRDASGL